ncbi:MAG: hypothetical protein ABI307_15275 [Mycobacterium sp.]
MSSVQPQPVAAPLTCAADTVQLYLQETLAFRYYAAEASVARTP